RGVGGGDVGRGQRAAGGIADGGEDDDGIGGGVPLDGDLADVVHAVADVEEVAVADHAADGLVLGEPGDGLDGAILGGAKEVVGAGAGGTLAVPVEVAQAI